MSSVDNKIISLESEYRKYINNISHLFHYILSESIVLNYNSDIIFYIINHYCSYKMLYNLYRVNRSLRRFVENSLPIKHLNHILYMTWHHNSPIHWSNFKFYKYLTTH